MQTPALVFTWFALLLTMSTVFLLFTSVFFGSLIDLKRVFSPIEPSARQGVTPPPVAAAQNEQNEPTTPNPEPVKAEAKVSSTPPDDSGTFGFRVQNVPPPDDCRCSFSPPSAITAVTENIPDETFHARPIAISGIINLVNAAAHPSKHTAGHELLASFPPLL